MRGWLRRWHISKQLHSKLRDFGVFKLHIGSGVLLPSGFHVRERTFRDSLPSWAFLSRGFPRQADLYSRCGMVLPLRTQVSRRHQMPRWILLHGKGNRQDGLCRRHGFCG